MRKIKITEEIVVPCSYCHGKGIIKIKDNRSILGYKISTIRKNLGITQEELSQVIGCTRTSIANIELGKQNLPIDKLYAIAQALKIEAKELF